jgi:formylglycine-generating enzyme
VIDGSSRGLRGGSWSHDEIDLRASSGSIGFDPTNESGAVGFRVASVPEPSGLVLTMLTSVVMLARRKR